jgi:hypothetical protein
MNSETAALCLDVGTSFADLVWKPIVLIEVKKRGADLSRHYRQAFDYWTRLVPNRPRYTILCNFDEFWIYDFEKQMDTPELLRLLAIERTPSFRSDDHAVHLEKDVWICWVLHGLFGMPGRLPIAWASKKSTTASGW